MEYFSEKKITDTYNDIKESQMCYCKQKKPDSKGNILLYSMIPLTWHSGKGKTVGAQNTSVLIRNRRSEEELTTKGQRELGGGSDGALLNLNYSSIYILHVVVKTSSTAH